MTLITLDKAVDGETQTAFEFSTQRTCCPLVMVEELNCAPLIPTAIPLTVQAYVGDEPPFTGCAVKVILLPTQEGFVPDVIEILTDGVTIGRTLNVNVAKESQPLKARSFAVRVSAEAKEIPFQVNGN